MATLKLEIGGMHCEHCVASIREAIQAVPGVVACRAELGHALVELRPGECSVADVTAAIQGAGPFSLAGFTRSD